MRPADRNDPAPRFMLSTRIPHRVTFSSTRDHGLSDAKITTTFGDTSAGSAEAADIQQRLEVVSALPRTSAKPRARLQLERARQLWSWRAGDGAAAIMCAYAIERGDGARIGCLQSLASISVASTAASGVRQQRPCEVASQQRNG